MRFGLCLNMDAQDKWGVGYERIGALARMGYDYLEMPLTQMSAMPQDVFEQEVLGRLSAAGIPCESCNNFFPADIKLTGPEADLQRIEAYVQRALGRAASMGAKVVVMGSSGARNLPEGTSVAAGYRQLAEALGVIGPIARSHGIRIAIEPLNKLESNILNSYLSALYLAALSGQSNVGALVDAYHFGIGNEPPQDLLTAPPTHVHYAELLGRSLPKSPTEAGRAFFAMLRNVGYDGRVSLEGYAGADFEPSCERAIQAAKQL